MRKTTNKADQLIKLFFIFSLLAIGTMKVQAQCGNLVPNPSFEDYTQCPNNIAQFNRVENWSVYRNNPDYFNSCDSTDHASVPYNELGYQSPISGQAYAGFIAFSLSGNQTTSFREYIGAQLNIPLSTGTQYYVSFKVSPTISNSPTIGSNKYVNNNLGVLFRMTSTTQLSIPNFAHVYSNSIISDTTAWVTISGSFIADSAYKYIVIGNFFDDSQTSFLLLNSSGSYPLSYYYIDDVCVSTDSLGCSISSCDDQDSCTTDTCMNGQCTHVPVMCDDHIECTGNSCNPISGCVYSLLDCNDNNLCTMDSCDSIVGCTYDSVSCQDNNICTKDLCDTFLGCQHIALSCDDQFPCTFDFCDTITGCIYSTVECSDNDRCTIDYCDSLLGCVYFPDTTCLNSVGSPHSEIIAVYPNPSDGLVTITGTLPFTGIKVYNALGQFPVPIIEKYKRHYTLDLSSQLPGVYLIVIETEESIYNYKIFVTH